MQQMRVAAIRATANKASISDVREAGTVGSSSNVVVVVAVLMGQHFFIVGSAAAWNRCTAEHSDQQQKNLYL